jgi:hypothetical protein
MHEEALKATLELYQITLEEYLLGASVSDKDFYMRYPRLPVKVYKPHVP